MHYLSKELVEKTRVSAKVRLKTNQWFFRSYCKRMIFLSLFVFVVVSTPLANAGVISLNGTITQGEFLAPQFVANPNQPGGGSLKNVDQLRLTGTDLQLAINISDTIASDTLYEGYSFVSYDEEGKAVDTNINISGILGDDRFGGFTFESYLRETRSLAVYSNGSLNIDLYITGSNDSIPYLAASNETVLRLSTPQVPNNVITVGDLVSFLQTTSFFTSGILPVEFFISSGAGDSQLARHDVAFELNAITTTVDSNSITSTPLPAAVWLFLSGLISLGLVKRQAIHANSAQ